MLLFFSVPDIVKTLCILTIAILTLLGIMIRPFRIKEATFALIGAVLLLLLGLISFQKVFQVLLHEWNTFFVFIAGMFILVQAVESTGLTTAFGQLLLDISGGNTFAVAMVGTFGSALGTNLINNVPMAVVMNSALQAIQHSPVAVRYGFIAATMFGCDLGPNLTTVGSLATILWLLLLRQRNLEVSGLDYFKVGILVTPLMLFVGATAIWLFLPR